MQQDYEGGDAGGGREGEKEERGDFIQSSQQPQEKQLYYYSYFCTKV